MKDGRISLKGTPVELQMCGLISNTLLDMQHKDNSTTHGEPDDIKDALGKPAGYRSDYIDSDVASGITANVLISKPEDEYNSERLRKIAEQKGINPNSDLSAIQGILIAKEEREEGYVKVDVWKTFMSACGNKLFWLSIIAAVIISEVILALKNYWIRIWVASARNPTVDFHTTGSFSPDMIPGATLFHALGFGYNSVAYIGHSTGLHGQNGIVPTIFNSSNSSVQPRHHSSAYWLGIYVLFGLLEAAWLAFMSFIIFYGGLKASRVIHKQLIRSIVHAIPRFFDTTPIGRIVSRFSGDMQTIDDDAPESIKELLVDSISVLTVYTIISSVFPAFTLVAIATSLVYAGTAYYYLNTSRELKRLESNSMSPLLSLFSELIQGVSTIRAFGTKHYYIKESLNCINAHNRAFYT
ncbi:hypothetical protein GGI25_006512, partial [Coemansia spiralis]